MLEEDEILGEESRRNSLPSSPLFKSLLAVAYIQSTMTCHLRIHPQTTEQSPRKSDIFEHDLASQLLLDLVNIIIYNFVKTSIPHTTID